MSLILLSWWALSEVFLAEAVAAMWLGMEDSVMDLKRAALSLTLTLSSTSPEEGDCVSCGDDGTMAEG